MVCDYYHPQCLQQAELKRGAVQLPDWAARRPAVLWLRVQAGGCLSVLSDMLLAAQTVEDEAQESSILLSQADR